MQFWAKHNLLLYTQRATSPFDPPKRLKLQVVLKMPTHDYPDISEPVKGRVKDIKRSNRHNEIKSILQGKQTVRSNGKSGQIDSQVKQTVRSTRQSGQLDRQVKLTVLAYKY